MTFLKDNVISAIGFIVVTISQLFVQLLVVRLTEPKLYGEYIFIFSVITMLSTVLIARSGEMAMKDIGKNWVKGNYKFVYDYYEAYKNLELRVNTIGFLIITCLLILFKFEIFNYSYHFVLLFILPLQSGYGASKAIIVSSGNIKEKILFEINYILFYLILGVSLVYFYGIHGLIFTVVLSELYKNLLARKLANKFIKQTNIVVDNINQTYFPLRDAFDFDILSKNIFIQGINNIDIIMLGLLRPSSDVALYKIAKTIALVPAQLFSSIWITVKPRLLRAYHLNKHNKVRKLIFYPLVLAISVLLIVYFIISFSSVNIFSYIYGENYTKSINIFIYLFFGIFIYKVTFGWFNFLLIISGEQKKGSLLFGIIFVLLIIIIFKSQFFSMEQISLNISLVMLFFIFLQYFFYRMINNKIKFKKEKND